MSYVRAEQILPDEIIELIQTYVDGACIYIPRKENHRREWGDKTKIKQELIERNQEIFTAFLQGCRIEDLALQYYLSEKSIQRIVYQMRKDEFLYESTP